MRQYVISGLVAFTVAAGVIAFNGRHTQGDHVEPYHQHHTHHVYFDPDCMNEYFEYEEMFDICLHITHIEE